MAQIADESYMKMIENQAAQGQDPGDARLWIKFEHRPMQNPEKSAEAGRPIYDEVEWIKIMVPGDRDEIERPATDMDKARFAKQYLHWKSGAAEAVTGTPLETWPAVTRAQVEELRFFKVRTVEDLANLADVVGAKFMGINDLKTKAKNFLAAAAGEAPAQKLQAELAQRDAEIATLQKALKDQSEKIDQLLKQRR
jgi:hypothetical protein